MVKGFEQAQKFGRSFMLPIAILPAAGLLLGIGGSLSNPETVKTYSFLDIFLLQAVFKIMSASGSIIFSNLAPIFSIGVAVGLARSDRGTAGIAAFIGYLVMNATIGVLIDMSGKAESLASGAVGLILGIKTLETGVFGGVVVGILTYYLHSRFNLLFFILFMLHLMDLLLCWRIFFKLQ